jgi:RNA polymerase sigma-70 factor (ECF subfamily)
VQRPLAGSWHPSCILFWILAGAGVYPDAKGVSVENNDKALVEKIVSGDREAFDAFYEKHFQKVYNYIFVQVRSHPDTEDLTQDVFMAAVQSFETYLGKSSLSSWLFGITKNMVRNWIRSKQKASSHFQPLEEGLPKHDTVDSYTPLKHIEYREFLCDWRRKLDKMSVESKKIFYMKHFDGLSTKDISRKTQRSIGAVKTDLYRTRKTLLHQPCSA